MKNHMSRPSWDILKKIAHEHLWPHKKALIITIFCMILSAISTALLAHSLKPIFNDIFIGHRKDLLIYVAGGILSIFIVKGFSEYGSTLLLENLGQRMLMSFQNKLFSHLIFLDLDFFHTEHEGKVTSLLLNDARTIKNSVLTSLSGIVKEGLTAISLLVVMIKDNGRLTLISLVGLPLVMGLLVICGRKVRKISLQLSQETGQLQVFFQQIFHNIALVKSCNTETREIDSLATRLQDLLAQTLRVGKVRAFVHPAMEILGGVAIVTVILIGGSQVMRGAQTTGSFLAFLTALFFVYRPLKNIIHLNTQIQEGLAAAQRIQSVMAIPPQSRMTSTVPQIYDKKVFAKDICFDKITFGYQGTPLFTDFSCTIQAQKRTALVGPSGSGKTSLFYLLLRFYMPQKGEILWGHHPIASMDVHHLRRHIALVTQDIALFDETIAYNISYGVPGASLAEVRRAAALAFADEFIDELPNGYHTRIGPHGIKLSGGQRQRLALARAFLMDAPLLLLDEATSALDTVSERKIQQALRSLTQQRTTLVIAHRLSTIEDADQILVMNKGHIVQTGTHQELIGQTGLYQKLASEYAAPQEPLDFDHTS
jgi:subfamily B ATP-binding cassette protein MsbA